MHGLSATVTALADEFVVRKIDTLGLAAAAASLKGPMRRARPSTETSIASSERVPPDAEHRTQQETEPHWNYAEQLLQCVCSPSQFL